MKLRGDITINGKLHKKAYIIVSLVVYTLIYLGSR